MLCAISGEAPQVAVASAKSGNVFEKRLIETYIAENGRDPVTGEGLTVEDLIDLKSARIVRPRPATLTSIPSLLSVFQSEWDALALETFTLRQHLTQTRQELSSVLYENDAAKRVIARLSRERDDARSALSKIEVNGGSGDVSMSESSGLPKNLLNMIDETQASLSKGRRKRTVPIGWASPEDIQNFKPTEKSKALDTRCQSVALDGTGNQALVGGENVAGIYDMTIKEWSNRLTAGARITDTLWAKDTAIISTESGAVKGFRGDDQIFEFSSHSGEVTAIALHPCGEILASVGVDRSYVFYDLISASQISQVETDSSLSTAAFHPDGHIFAAGGKDCQIRIFDVKTGVEAARFTELGPIQALSFSENGTWLAVSIHDSSSISIWDLRKGAQLKTLEIGGPVSRVRFDYTGQFLASVGPSGLSVQQYSKSTKQWSEILRFGVPTGAVEWGAEARRLITVNEEGAIIILGDP